MVKRSKSSDTALADRYEKTKKIFQTAKQIKFRGAKGPHQPVNARSDEGLYFLNQPNNQKIAYYLAKTKQEMENDNYQRASGNLYQAGLFASDVVQGPAGLVYDSKGNNESLFRRKVNVLRALGRNAERYAEKIEEDEELSSKDRYQNKRRFLTLAKRFNDWADNAEKTYQKHHSRKE